MKLIPQHDQMDCGPACIAMISAYFGKKHRIDYIRNISYLKRDGVSLRGISEAAEKIGFSTHASMLDLTTLDIEGTLPCVLHWNQNHFVVLYNHKKNILTGKYKYKIADPSHGLISLNEEEFKSRWLTENDKGVALFLHPTEEFYKKEVLKKKRIDFKFLLGFLKPYKKEVFQLFLGLMAGSLFTLIFPFLTQSLIDKGVESKSLSIVFIILLAQVFLFLGSIVIEIVRNWIMLYIGTRINITIISDFFKKILKLPINFFDSKLIGDFNQRIQDHERIEEFLTSQSLVTLFSIINFSIFFFVLLYYDYKIVIAYSILTLVAVLWSIYFLKKRRILDYYRFQRRSENQESIYEMINGIQEIKLNSFEDFKRKEWETIQVKLFGVNLRALKLDQFQLMGFNFINQLKNILVTFIAAREVIFGNITLGSMLAIAYIIGQMNSPVNQLISFFRSLQDARLSMERLSEVQDQEEEEKEGQIILSEKDLTYQNGVEKGIRLNELDYQYEGPKSPFVLKNINLFIPEGKTTAIVGASGSGKTTLMKILLKFYNPVNGSAYVNQHDLKNISPKNWRENCGVVMQEGYIFSGTIERNIATGDDEIDEERLQFAIKTANIEEFISGLPQKLKTKIGASGNGISGGQKQRILIARSVYKNPHYIFFDEATSALDAENEKIIHNNLQAFFKNKTVVIIAHRLSTVKNADQIVVLKSGKIVEQGTHTDLVNNKSNYYNLVKNQLELGS
ncbi:peptidase domain-containing ABC transporter [Psychroserpens luteolus]|uniref:peptidase domain-containing ABC transporter n=1 Tax=Psychroserpens luteolus TaxID=2855840 RepID=UPI001E650DD5|nr:peptidase domain-containing ABC transporter [Psychroserpens luteolus]MCD2258059.1 peptidase domain-containing ABC transporter [Psychroserpens luteolus]